MSAVGGFIHAVMRPAPLCTFLPALHLSLGQFDLAATHGCCFASLEAPQVNCDAVTGHVTSASERDFTCVLGHLEEGAVLCLHIKTCL